MRRLATILLVLAAAACGGDKPNAPKRLEGTYTLRTVNGANPPTVIYDDPASGQRAEIISGSITLGSDGTFSAPWSFRLTDNGAVTNHSETCTGTFTRSGNHVVMEEADNQSWCGGQFDGDWDGSDTFTEDNVVYRR